MLDRLFSTLALATIGLGATSHLGRPSGLRVAVGDPAPQFSVARWVKGKPVGSFDKGRIYVVEFWATWCGPCKMAIPHLTDLQKKYREQVTFIGVDCYEPSWSQSEPFVKSEGPAMDYEVCLDQPDHAGDRNGFMTDHWLAAAKQEGIPTAFIVDRDGKIAWIGHPMSLDEPLTRVVSNTWDRGSAAERFLAAAKSREEADNTPAGKLRLRYREDMDAKRYPAALADVDAMSAMDPNLGSQCDQRRLQVYAASGDKARFDQLAERLLKGRAINDPGLLHKISGMIVDPHSKLVPRNGALALTAAKRAAQLSNRSNVVILDTLAWSYYWSGRKADAVVTEKEAISKLPSWGDGSGYHAALLTFEERS